MSTQQSFTHTTTERRFEMDITGNLLRSTPSSNDSDETDSAQLFKETSMTGNDDHDIIIRDSGLKWFPFEEFEDVKFVARGGFSSIYYATRLGRKRALKCIEGSNE